MKSAFLIIALVFGGCATQAERSKETGKQEFVLYGVGEEGIQLRQFPLTISEAIQQAGGLRNCVDCFRSGGEALLWESVGPARIRRGESIIDVKSGDFDAFQIQPNDIVYISHKLL